MEKFGLVCCVLTTVCWGISPIFLRKSLDTFDSTEINAVRSVGAVAGSLLLCLMLDPRLIAWKHGFSALGVVGLVMLLSNVIGDIFYLIALDNIGVGRALSTTNSYPVFVALFSIYWLGESPSLRLWIGIGIIVIGLALLNYPKKNSAASSDGKVRSNSLGFFLALLAAVLWAAALSLQKWAVTEYKIKALEFALWRGILLTAATWGVWYFRKNGPDRKHVFKAGMKKWFSPVCSGILSLSLGGVTFARALETIPVSTASPITASNPMIAALIAKIVFNEKLSAVQWLGVAMTVIGGIEVSS